MIKKVEEKVDQNELEFWKELITSGNFKYLNNIWREHAKHLLKKALIHIRNREFEQGYAQLARYDDTIKRVDLIQMRIDKLRKEGK